MQHRLPLRASPKVDVRTPFSRPMRGVGGIQALLSVATPTYTVTQIAERFEPNTVLWTSTQYSHILF